eukprot:4134920-Pyramimonas_sp.AAC.1
MACQKSCARLKTPFVERPKRTSTAQPMKSNPAPRLATVAGENAETSSSTGSMRGGAIAAVA